ncbi:MAG: hypothetical protein JKY37_21470 [Nannocystaceae bacterium]|nr:hypothetical protein [Nannocystaceae bacterium]
MQPSRRHNTAPEAHDFVHHRLLTPGQRPLLLSVMCSGDADDPVCSAGASCTITGDGVLNLCLPTCNPWLDDCGEGQVCVPNSADFWCVPELADPTGIGEACSVINECVSGSTCVNDVDCEFGSCCSPYCDLADPDPNAPCAEDQVCIAWFDPPDQAPPGLQSLGVCVLQ